MIGTNTMEKLELTEQQLREMELIAVQLGAPPSASYSQCQQILTIKSLEKFLATFGIELPVSVDKLGGFSKPEREKR